MTVDDRVALATIPTNTYGSEPTIVGRGERDLTTGSIAVEVPKYTSYQPPAGWTVEGVYASDDRAKVYIKRRTDQ